MILTTRALAAGAWRVAAWLITGIALAACQSFGDAPGSSPGSGGWRVLERLGDARFQAPGAMPWTPAIAGSQIPAASRVTTGDGGRVILAATDSQISAGPGSEFTLPADGPAGPLDQQNGRLRFRVAVAGSDPLLVRTPFLGVLVNAGVFEVLVSATATEVSVESGELRVVTPDGARQASLAAGQSVYATGPRGEEIAVHLPHDRAFEPAVVPAMRSRPETPVSALAQPSSVPSSANRSAGARPEIPSSTAPSASVAVKADVPPGNAMGQRHLAADRPAAEPGQNARTVDRPPTPFDRLTRGMLRDLPAAAPVPAPRPARPSP